MPSLVTLSPAVRANPTDGVVVNGVAEFNAEIPGHLQILQHTDKAIINWGDFSIADGEITQFFQPSATSAALNRVVGVNPSVLNGLLTGNGKILLINQNGIMVGPNGVIDVFGGFIGSTLDIDDADFLNGGDDRFYGGSTAGVTNYGRISSAQGDIFLIGHHVDNQGIIGSVDGTVGLAAGGDVLIKSQGDERVFVNAGAGTGTGTGVNNAGSITGATVELKAHGNVYALAINNSGVIRATGAVNKDGRVMLTASPAGGNITNTGTITANNLDGSGGQVFIDGGPGSVVDIAAGEVSANGTGGLPGGTVTVLGDTITIGNATVSADGGDGGRVLIGSAGADGSTPATSVSVGGGARVSASGSAGDGGTVIIAGDPSSTIVVAGQVAADGAVNGGFIQMVGGQIDVLTGSVVSADGEQNGGTVTLAGDQSNGTVRVAGTLSAKGATGDGGTVNVSGSDVVLAEGGIVDASGGADGGTVVFYGENSVTTELNSLVIVDGGENGGTINVDSAGETFIGGTLSAVGQNGVGGNIDVTGEEVIIGTTASVDASGAAGGGIIQIGGAFQGGDSNVRNSESTVIGRTSTIKADSYVSGNGGRVIVWSNGDTIFNGDISAAALGATGNGGFIEVSGYGGLKFFGTATANSVGGDPGSILADPPDVSIGDDLSIDNILISTIRAALQSGSNFWVGATGGGAGSGNITLRNVGLDDDFDEAIQWNTSADFGLFAEGDITLLTHVRNAGSGSINLAAGWDGTTGFTELSSNDPEGAMAAIFADPTAYGNGTNGSVFINDLGNGRHVEVGSRYGDTNLAARNLLLVGSSGGTRRHAQLGFRDAGWVYVASGQIDYGGGGSNETVLGLQVGEIFGEGYTSAAFDIVAQAGSGTAGVGFTNLVAGSVAVTVDPNGTPIVYLDDGSGNLQDGSLNNVGTINYATGEITFTSSIDAGGLGVEVAFTKDAEPNNGETYTAIVTDRLVSKLDDDGELHYGTTASSSVDGELYYDPDGIPDNGDEVYTFVPFNDHKMDAVTGNWWWRELTDGTDGEGNKLPENGATGNITVYTKGAVLLQSGTSGVAYTQIGHGGQDVENDNISYDGRTNVTDADRANNAPRSVNWSTAGRQGTAIARLAPVESDIIVRAGIDPATGETTQASGLVQLIAGQTGSTNAYSQIGHLGNGQFGEVDGNITVDAGGDIDLRGGQGWGHYAVIGHSSVAPGNEASRLGDSQIRFFNSAGVANNVGATDFNNATLRNAGQGAAIRNDLSGNIDVTGRGTGGIDLIGGTYGTLTNTERGRAYAQIGHGGMTNTMQLYNLSGDINVDAQKGGIRMIAGQLQGAYTQIGHGGYNGGNANSDFIAGDITVNSFGSLIMRAGEDADIIRNTNGARFSHSMIGHGGYNARQQHKSGDITVTVGNGGDLIMTGGPTRGHFVQIGHGGDTSRGQVGGTYARPTGGPTYNGSANITVNVDGSITMNHMESGNVVTSAWTATNTLDRRFAFVQIGHGGWESDRENTTNATGSDKIGDISVIAGDSITMENGDGRGYSTGIGHLGGVNDDNFNAEGSIYVESTNGDIILNADAAEEANNDLSTTTSTGQPAYENGVKIGHGGFRDNDNVNSDGSITVVAGNDVTLRAGKGYLGSMAQIGHGTFGTGDDDGVNTGDIYVSAVNDINLIGTQNGWVQEPTDIGIILQVEGAQAMIGHGGYRQDGAGSSGNILVFAGNDLNMEGPTFTDVAKQDGGSQYVGTFGALVRIGHGSFIEPGNFTGDITIVVGNDLNMTGAQTADPATMPHTGSVVQIGNGGPRVSGNHNGDINIRVGNNLTIEDSDDTSINDNGVQIGNGDWMRDTPADSGAGLREGDITISVGGSASFDHSLVGHVDPYTTDNGSSAIYLSGNTYVGASRNNPFYGATDTLTATNGAVFTSGLFGGGSELRFYVPQRSLNLIDTTVRLNEASITYIGTDADFAMPSSDVLGVQAAFQRADEIYLQPDLWWDNNEDSPIAGSSAFAVGSVAQVDDPGGFSNLTGFAAGDLGSGTADYNGSNSVSGTGQYTFYYDAIEDVTGLSTGGAIGGSSGGSGSTEIPETAIVVIPEVAGEVLEAIVLPFNYLPYLDPSVYDSFIRTQDSYLLAELGDDALDDEEDDEEKDEGNGRQSGKYATYMIYDLSVGQYNSLRIFGQPGFILPVPRDTQ